MCFVKQVNIDVSSSVYALCRDESGEAVGGLL